MEFKDSENNLDEKEKTEALTVIQRENLKNFLKKIGYSKEELVFLFEAEEGWKKIPEKFFQIRVQKSNLKSESSFLQTPEYKTFLRNFQLQKFTWSNLLYFLSLGFDVDFLIKTIAGDLYNRFEKTISQGQAEAVLRRVLDIKLSSAGRTQLYELRKKIRKYDKLVSNFGELTNIFDYKFKIVIMGLNTEQSSKVLPKPTIPELKDQRSTLGVQFCLKTMEISDKRVQLQLWDISTEKQYKTLIQLAGDSSYMYWISADVNGVIIVYDKSNRESFNLARESYNELKKATNLKFELKEKEEASIDVPIIIVGLGNGKKVSAEAGQVLAKEIGAYGYIEISDLDTQSFDNVFSSLSLGIITNIQNALKRYGRKFRFKVAVVGDGRVGKTSLIKKFTQGLFQMDYVKTIGGQYSVYDKVFERDKVRYLFWDIAGSDAFHFLRERFFRNSRAAVIVYSLEDNEYGIDSFDHISDWSDDVRRFCGNIPIILIANKADLIDEKEIDQTIIQDVVTKNNFLGYFITSAKMGKGLFKAFNKIIEELYNSYKDST